MIIPPQFYALMWNILWPVAFLMLFLAGYLREKDEDENEFIVHALNMLGTSAVAVKAFMPMFLVELAEKGTKHLALTAGRAALTAFILGMSLAIFFQVLGHGINKLEVKLKG